jgi:hypothetical protein
MKFLLWLERHFVWLPFHRVESSEMDAPILDQLHAMRAEPRVPPVPAKTHRSIIVNLATSVGSAILIGVVSGLATAERATQRITDRLENHDLRIVTIEQNYVQMPLHKEESQKFKVEFDSVNQRESETRTQLITLQSEFNEFLLQQRNLIR